MIRARDYSIDYILKHSLIFHFILTHSAANKAINNANFLNATTNTETNYKLISIGSPIAESDLRESTNAVGGEFIGQVNHPDDPIVQITNEEVPLKIRGIGQYINRDYLNNTHGYEMYLRNYGIKDIIENIMRENAMKENSEKELSNGKN